jgi:hypothetical protein
MGSLTSKCDIELDAPININCTECDQFYPSKEIECDRCNSNTISTHQCTKLPSGKFGYIYYATRKCSQHIRCICCQKNALGSYYWSSVITYHLSQFQVFMCKDCGFRNHHENFVQTCLEKQMEYKNHIFYFLLLQFHLLPHDLKVIILDYCHFFDFDDYLVNQGFYFWNSRVDTRS